MRPKITQEAASRIQNTWNKEEASGATINDEFTLDDLDIGPPIAKGCAAVVYAASMKKPDENKTDYVEVPTRPSPAQSPVNLSSQERMDVDPSPRRDSILASYKSGGGGMLSPIHNLSRFVHNFGGSVDNLFMYGNRLMGSQINLLRNDNEENAENAAMMNRSRHNSEISQFEMLDEDVSVTTMVSYYLESIKIIFVRK